MPKVQISACPMPHKLEDHNIRNLISSTMTLNRKLDADQIERTKREISIMKKLDHENIIKMFGEIETPKKLYIVMELIDGDGKGRLVVEWCFGGA